MEYAKNIDALKTLICEIYGLVQGRGIKQKLTRVTKALENSTSELSEDNESDTSTTSDCELME